MSNLENAKDLGQGIYTKAEVDSKTVIKSATEPTSPSSGDLWFDTDNEILKLYTTAAGWIDVTQKALGTIDNPATSAAQIKEADPAATDGLYYIYMDDGNAYPIWCDMTNDGGGWMMAARVHTDNTLWTYDNAVWTNATLYNSTAVYDYEGHIKSPAYTMKPFNSVRIAMQQLTNGIIESTWANATSFSTFMSSGTSSSVSRSAWLDMVEEAWGIYGQAWLVNCNQFGTNRVYNYQYARLGGSLNNEAHCTSNDESVGFGLKGISPYTNNISCGSFSPYGKSSGNRIGWIFIK
jgi:uncharacterized protein YbdZ (MbtH family)